VAAHAKQKGTVMAGVTKDHDHGAAAAPRQPRIPDTPPDEQKVGGLHRPWYHPRPQRGRTTDLLGFNGMWWLTALLVILVLVEPWWW
jgi:hypothetical protein